MTHDGLTPTLGCRCRPCHAARLRIWRGLTDPQRHALDVLDFAVPRHPTDLSRNAGVRHASLAVLLFPATRRPALVKRPALIRQHLLAERLATARSMTFYTLNQHGAEIRAAARTAERKAA